MSRIDSGTILVAFFAILFGLVGAFLLRKTLQKKPVAQAPPEVRRGPAKITVPLASRNLPSGTRITLDDVALFSLTREEMKEHGIKRVFMSNPDQIIGKTVAVDLQRGSTFDTKDFYPPGTGPGIADKLQPGQRAVTIDVTATSALLGFAGAGQNVDVLFHYGLNSRSANGHTGDQDLNDRYQNNSDYWEPEHFQYNSPRGLNAQQGSGRRHRHYDDDRRAGISAAKYHNATVTLVQKATILALGQRVNQTGHSSQLGFDERVRVTLAVKPESAELIRVAEGHGELSLTLRGSDDEEIIKIDEPATLSNIIVVEEEPVQIARREVRDMDIYRGQNRSSVRFLRDRDTGKDDFQKWILLKENPQSDQQEPKQQQGDEVKLDLDPQRLSGPNIEPNKRPNLGPNFEQNFGPNTERNRGYRNLETADGFLIDPREKSELERLRSDFRKIKTLFNQEPELRDRLEDSGPINIDAPQPIDLDEVSSKATEDELRSATAVELYDPRWE